MNRSYQYKVERKEETVTVPARLTRWLTTITPTDLQNPLHPLRHPCLLFIHFERQDLKIRLDTRLTRFVWMKGQQTDVGRESNSDCLFIKPRRHLALRLGNPFSLGWTSIMHCWITVSENSLLILDVFIDEKVMLEDDLHRNFAASNICLICLICLLHLQIKQAYISHKLYEEQSQTRAWNMKGISIICRHMSISDLP